MNLSETVSHKQAAVLVAAVRELALHIAGVGDTSGCYGLAYGSHAAGRSRHDSDLDLLLVSPRPVTAALMAHLTETVIELHRRHGLTQDIEVACEVKLAASHDDIRAAVYLRPFPYPPPPGAPVVPSVPDEPSYLNSQAFRRRLILNALTGPHVFLGGDLVTYRRHARAAEAGLALLALRILVHARNAGACQDRTPALDGAHPGAGRSMSLPELVDALTTAHDGATYRDYLGYQTGPELVSTLLRGLCELRDAGVAVNDASGDGPSVDWRPGPRWFDAAAVALEDWQEPTMQPSTGRSGSTG